MKIILVNRVNFDGMGDFYHFVDIRSALINNPQYQGDQFISVVCAEGVRYEQVKAKLAEFRLSDCFLLDGSKGLILSSDHPLIKHFAEADQMIEISLDGFPWCVWAAHFNPQGQYKFIGEHELTAEKKKFDAVTRISYPMGLSEGCYGLKLQQTNRLQPVDALSLMGQHDLTFVEHLIHFSTATSIENFCQTNVLIPAYIKSSNSFGRFLLLMAINHHFAKNKDIAVYVSGMGDAATFSKKIEAYLAQDRDDFMSSYVRQVEIIQAGEQSVKVHAMNPKGNRVVRLFNGFNLSESSYSVLYQQALFGGVSGDNTFERAVSFDMLPFYHSSNDSAGGKKKTRIALSEIIEKLDIPEPTKSDFINFFRGIDHFIFGSTFRISHTPKGFFHHPLGVFKDMNLDAMIEAWPIVSTHLKKHHNFYDKLGAILADVPSCDEDPAFKPK